MAKGVAGYTRDGSVVGCPWDKSGARPCVARLGRLALAGDPPLACAGCGNYLGFLWRDLQDDYEPARIAAPHDPMDSAQAFRAIIWSATAEEARGGLRRLHQGPVPAQRSLLPLRLAS